MLTPQELERLIQQINSSFEQDRQKIKALEDRVKALEDKKPGRPKKAAA